MKRQRRLPPLRISHPVNHHIIRRIHIAHRLRRDQNELSPHTPPRSLNHQAHTLRPVHAVHEHVKLIQTADRRAHGLPDTQQQADRRKRLLASGEGLGLTTCVRGAVDIGLDGDFELLLRVREHHSPAEVAFAEQVAEVDAGAERDVFTEEAPATMALGEGFLELLSRLLASE